MTKRYVGIFLLFWIMLVGMIGTEYRKDHGDWTLVRTTGSLSVIFTLICWCLFS